MAQPLRPASGPLIRAFPRLLRALAGGLVVAAALGGVSPARALAPVAGGRAGVRTTLVDINARPDFPHPAAYVRLGSDGFELNSDSMVAKLARFSVCVIPASPATETYANRLAQIRALNPRIILLAYFPSDFMWDQASQYAPGNVYGDCYQMFQANDWWLYGTDGQPFEYFGHTYDLTRSDVTTAFANYLYTHVLATGEWDGIFLDDFCESNWWKQAFTTQLFDENRDGVPDDKTTFDTAWKAGTDSLAAKLRALAGPTMPIVGNCAYGSKWTTMNGWMREDFPNQGNWDTNMFSASGGYMVNEQNFRSPHFDFVYGTSQAAPNNFSLSNLQLMRFCLGSSLLGDGYFMFDPQLGNAVVADYWYDEYDNAGKGTGYLGQPLAGFYQQVGQLGTPNNLVNGGFESGFASWTPYNLSSTTVLDSVGSPEGKYSAHARVPTATLYQSQVKMEQNVTLRWGNYAMTFWARAAVPRQIWANVQMVNAPNTILCDQPITIGTTWQLYQVTFANSTDFDPVQVRVNMGQQTGDVWVDDIRVQTGASSVYRRDFQHGIVMVNTTAYSVTLPLEKQYTRLTGPQDPATNNGATLTQITIPSRDAAFLLNAATDVVPPAAVIDLHAIGSPH